LAATARRGNLARRIDVFSLDGPRLSSVRRKAAARGGAGRACPLLALLAPALAAAPALATPAPPPPMRISRASAPIVVDGELSDAGWKDALKIDQFYETSPGDNIPAKVKTTVWLTYDDRYLYIGVQCDDPDPRQIRAPYVDRDQVLGTDDNIAVFLDTRNDRRSAVELRVNPRGIQGDAVFNDANQNEDFSPDFFYDTAARIGAGGWSAEYRIPFSSLRYPPSDPQTWGILIWRLIGQYSGVDRAPSLYTFAVPRRSGTFLGSLLYSYKLNRQTVLFIGYGDDRVRTESNGLLTSDRTVFVKVSYAIQR
jgi:hypothetical protein